MAKRRPHGSGHVYRPKTRNAAGAAALRTTLDDIAAIVENDYRNNGRGSLREVERAFQRLREFFGVDLPARQITAAHVEQYKSTRLESGVSPATINRELAQLRRGLRLAVNLGRLTLRPTFSLLREGGPREGFLEPHQFEAIRSHLKPDLRPLVTFLYWTGWRRTEAMRLEWRQVDRKAGVLRIEKSKNNKARTIPYAALPVLRELIEDQRAKTTELERREGVVIPYVFHRETR